MALACDGQQNELWKWNGNNFEKASGTIPMTTYNTKEVTSFEVNGETYLAFANQNQKNEVRKWNGNEFIDTRENSIPFTKSNTKEVTSFEINGETYLAFANQYQKNGVRKWNGKRFTDISDNIPNPLPDERGNIEYTNSQAVTSFEIAGITYLA
ncbi:MAG: hypothetical protein LBP53_06635, partial [Candidatus Peribacteria bacterium]|nr:hypothetical protein [Candidatus Peribacteria bacterium]